MEEEEERHMSVLNIKNPEAYRLASDLSQATGKSLTRVVVDALRTETERLLPRPVDMDKVREILARFDAMAVRDPRSAREIVNDLYDERGMWK
jgi:antitoxin VapB